jgi:DNA polymerase-1
VRALLVDGTNIVMRYAFAALGDRQAEASDNDQSRVLGSVERAMRDCAAEFSCSHLIVALDSPAPSWRRAKYPTYKTNRSISTADWSHRLHVWCETAGIRTEHFTSFEADDVIATLATRIVRYGDVFALSGDSDLLVLAAIGIGCVQFGGKGEPRWILRSAKWVAEKYGIASAALLTDFKALVGEPGENIPGVPGIGPAKARKLLTDYGSVAAMLSGKVLDAEPATTMFELVTLRCDLPIRPIKPSDCRLQRMAVAS